MYPTFDHYNTLACVYEYSLLACTARGKAVYTRSTRRADISEAPGRSGNLQKFAGAFAVCSKLQDSSTPGK